LALHGQAKSKSWIKWAMLALKHTWEAWTTPGYVTTQAKLKNSDNLERILKKALKETETGVDSLTEEETQLIHTIRRRTDKLNINNITRTEAYWDLYRRHPEIHWAHLAHMVSRNGGWNMTDLQGEMLPRLLSTAEAEHFFSFLERCNALIFQDAYPQLLLYEESKRRGIPLFHLLSALNISKFMRVMWNRFWQHRQSSEITIALIVNEQNYIEDRVVRNPYFKKTVLGTWEFKAQALLQMNEVFFPYRELGSRDVKLAGQVCYDFNSLEERIDLGKRLYSILFDNSMIFRGVLEWAKNHPHTGSRVDFWPQLFTHDKQKQNKAEIYSQRLSGCELLPQAAKLYSPFLEEAWPNQPIDPPGVQDWFKDEKAAKYLKQLPSHIPFRLTVDYCNTLNTVEAAILLKEKIQ
jgi:hypothetical protein